MAHHSCGRLPKEWGLDPGGGSASDDAYNNKYAMAGVSFCMPDTTMSRRAENSYCPARDFFIDGTWDEPAEMRAGIAKTKVEDLVATFVWREFLGLPEQ